MKRKDWEVKDDGIRPAGDKNHCFYCGEEKGSQHKNDCVIRCRTIIMEMKINIPMDVPEFWDIEQCEFHKNKGSWCANNILSYLEELIKNHGCLCSLTEFTFIREATQEDEEYYNIYVDKLPS